MKLVDWIRAYDIEKGKKFLGFFYSNGKPLFNDPKFFDTYVEKIPTRMKMKTIFYDLSYWENIKFFLLLYPMHILKIIHLIYGGRYH